MWIKGTVLVLLVGIEIDTATMEDVMEIPSKIRNKTSPYDPAIPLPRKLKFKKIHVYPNVNCSTIYNS